MDSIQDSARPDKIAHIGLSIAAILSGIISSLHIFEGSWALAFGAYAFATILRLNAGAIMNRMGDAETVNAWNNRYHRYVVIALNSVVGFVLLGRLAWDVFKHHTHIGPFVFLAAAFVAYFIAARFTAPNTFGARVRSATLTIVLIITMAYLAWPGQWGLLILGAVLAINFAVLRLRTLQRRFGWADR